MKTMMKAATSLMAVAMMTVPMMALAQSSQQGNASMESSMNDDWQTPPASLTQPQGYKDGIEAAKLDKLVQRPMDPKLGHNYLNPPMDKGPKRDAYRLAYVAGYQAAVQHGAVARPGDE